MSVSSASGVGPNYQQTSAIDKILSRSSKVSGELENLMQENVELKKMNVVQRIKTKAAEKERDFYFGKLRDIELLIMEGKREAPDLLRAVQKILYAKEDENIEVDEEGNILVWDFNINVH